MKCNVCQTELEEYGQSYFEIKLERNYQSQGYPAVGTVGTVTCCVACLSQGAELARVLEVLKRLRK